MGRRSALLAVILGLALAVPPAADAHALLQSSDPAAGSTVATSPSKVVLTFGEAPDPKLSSIKVLDAAGSDWAAGSDEAVAGEPSQLQVALKSLPDGVYTVSWRTVSSVDGHAAAGSFAFGVGAAVSSGAPQSAAAGSSQSGSPAAALAHWLLYIGLVAMFGAAFVAFAIEPRPPRVIVRTVGLGWLLAALGTVAVIAVQWSETGADPSTIIGSSVGFGALQRVVATAGMGIVVAVLFAWPGAIERWLFGLAAAAAAGAMLIEVNTGHAAAGSSWALQVVVQWLHFVGVGLWIGGLAALLLLVRGSPSEVKSRLVRRFSTWAAIALVVVAASGIVRAINEVGTIDALVTTDVGRLIIAKSAVLVVLAGLGAVNRWFNVPRALRMLAGVRRVGTTEVAIGAFVLALTAVLVNLAPPTSSAAAGAGPSPATAPVVAMGSDFGTSVRLKLVVSPGSAGFNQFVATATDYDSGAPSTASAVGLRFELASRTSVGPSTLALASRGDGHFAAGGGNLSLDGIWRVTATVAGPTGSVEVPLVVPTAVAAQQVDVVATQGAPTISTVHLPDGRTVQLYLDPGRTGANELHATFFDAAGTELPVPAATFAISPQDDPASIVAPRQLEPGHFVAEVSVAAGPVVVDVVGTDPASAGAQLHAHLTMQVEP